MFNKFPREIGPPRKLVYNKEEFNRYVNLYNGKKSAVYNSIYSFHKLNNKKPDYDCPIIDKIYFDFDDKECNAWEETNKLHKYCLEKDIEHVIIMSGRGYHFYVLCIPYKTDNAKGTIYNAQHEFIDKLNLKVDSHVIGNSAQLARIPNTWNGKAKLFCIPLCQEEFKLGDKFVKELAVKQSFTCQIIGKNKFDLKTFDYEVKGFDNDYDIKEVEINLEKINDKKIPNCIKNIINNKDSGWKQRYLLILYFRELGHSKKEIYDILKLCLSPKKFHHCIRDEKQLQYLYQRKDLMFPSCKKIKLDGFCTGKCTQYNAVIYR